MSEPRAASDCLARAQDGDSLAFAELVRQHQSGVRKQLRWLCHGDLALADDLAQNSFLQAWVHLRDYQGTSRFATWLHSIAYKQFLMHVRSHKPSTPLADSEHQLQSVPSSEPMAQDLRLDVQAALHLLPASEQAAILHCYYLDLSQEDAALVLGLPLGTLKSQVLRAKARLRESLASWKPEHVR